MSNSYIPFLEDISIGFKCEIQLNGNWIPTTIGPKHFWLTKDEEKESYSPLEGMLLSKQIRVPFLSNEEILSLGFTLDPIIKKTVFKYRNNKFQIQYNFETKLMNIYSYEHVSYKINRMYVPDINKLKRVLNYINE